MDVAWDGITRAETLNEDAANVHAALADAAKGHFKTRLRAKVAGSSRKASCNSRRTNDVGLCQTRLLPCRAVSRTTLPVPIFSAGRVPA